MNSLFKIYDLRFEISFNTFDQLRQKLYFYINNNIKKINIPCKANINNKFLLDSIQICRSEFPSINLIPHFSIQYEFNSTKDRTINKLINFIKLSIRLECEDILLVSGSARKLSLDSVTAINYLKDNIIKGIEPIGVAFNPYLPDLLFLEELRRLKLKLYSGLVHSIWIQFGTNYIELSKNILVLNTILNFYYKANPRSPKIILYASILVPSKLFNARFKFRPWKGVYCSEKFLSSLDYANDVIGKMLCIYKKNGIIPIIETDTSSEKKIIALKNYIEF